MGDCDFYCFSTRGSAQAPGLFNVSNCRRDTTSAQRDRAASEIHRLCRTSWSPLPLRSVTILCCPIAVAGVALAPLRFDRCFVRKASYTAETPMLKKALLFGVLALASVGTALAQGKAQLIIESWRNDDLKVWRDTIIPAFTKKHPDIPVVLSPIAPRECNAVLEPRLTAG